MHSGAVALQLNIDRSQRDAGVLVAQNFHAQNVGQPIVINNKPGAATNDGGFLMQQVTVAGGETKRYEIHPDPERALSDGYQSLNFPQFLDTLSRCRAVAAALGKVM